MTEASRSRGLHAVGRRSIWSGVKGRRKLDEAARRDHQRALLVLGKLVVATPIDLPLRREFVLLTA